MDVERRKAKRNARKGEARPDGHSSEGEIGMWEINRKSESKRRESGLRTGDVNGLAIVSSTHRH